MKIVFRVGPRGDTAGFMKAVVTLVDSSNVSVGFEPGSEHVGAQKGIATRDRNVSSRHAAGCRVDMLGNGKRRLLIGFGTL